MRKGINGREVEEEPYMVMVGAQRRQGDTVLFDSEHRHQNYIALTIVQASRERGLSRDWIFGGKEIIEVAMSEAQWASMISSLNFGSGVPGTLQRLQGERIPQPKLPAPRTDEFSKEIVTAITDVLDRLNELKKGKHTKATMHELDVITSHLKANIPFVAESFDKHMEDRVEKAKVEIEAHMVATVQRAGLDALLTQAQDRQDKLLDAKFEAMQSDEDHFHNGDNT